LRGFGPVFEQGKKDRSAELGLSDSRIQNKTYDLGVPGLRRFGNDAVAGTDIRSRGEWSSGLCNILSRSYNNSLDAE